MTTQTPTAIPPTRHTPTPETPSPAPPPSTVLVDVPAMAAAAGSADPPAGFTLDIRSVLSLLPDDDGLDEWFMQFTAANEHSGYRFEIDGKGRLLAMASESRDGAERQLNLQYDLVTWTNTGPGGKVMTGNELVRVGQRGRRSADAGWIAPEQVAELPPPGRAVSRHTLCPPLCSGDSLHFRNSRTPAGQNGGMAGLRGGAGLAD